MTIWFDDAAMPVAPYWPPAGTLSEHLGIVFTEFGAGGLSATMPVDARTRQPMGLLHGGASVALAETVMSAGAAWTVDRARFAVLGVEINANHLRGVREGLVTATARPVHRGRTLQIWQCDIRSETNEAVCTARMTVLVQERAQ